MAWAPDGSNRLFVIRKGGEVRIVKDGVLQSKEFATVTPIFTDSECGLIGMCFDPNFYNNGHVYFFVTVSNHEQRIVRYTEVDGVGTAPVVIVAGLPTQGQNHDGGSIGIGPDGALYWGIGDLGNGTGVNANLTSLAAKIGRANRFTGAPMPDNPFVDAGGPNNDYIWARGFRNPFTMTFQPRTGKLWLDVVGTSYEQIFVVSAGSHGGYNDFENNQPGGFLPPTIVYRTNDTDTRNLTASGANRSGGVTTYTTTNSHGFRQGAKITITGVGDASFNGSFFVKERVSNTQFTVNQAGADASSGGGAAETQPLGGCVTGGYFYDSTLFPPEYRGNFFFGDFNSGKLMRVTLDANNQVGSVDEFVTELDQQVDVTVGPDGALYYLDFSSGAIRKLVPSTIDQGLVVSPTAIRVQEGGSSIFTVRLAKQPEGDVAVDVNKQPGGDADLTTTTTSLTFTTVNWNQPQTVIVYAAQDQDTSNGEATIRVHSGTLADVDVLATEIDGVVQTTPNLVVKYSTGDEVPGESGARFAGFGLPSLDGAAVGFVTTLKAEGQKTQAIFGGDTPAVLLRQGEDAPGTDGSFAAFKDPVFASGKFAFIGTLKRGSGVGNGTNDGVWSNASGSLTLLAREGSEAPDTTGAVFKSFTSLALPKSGGAVFVAALKPGSGPSDSKVKPKNDLGLWREVAGVAKLMIREGDKLTLRDGPERTVKSFEALPNVPGSEDQRRSHRSNGDVLVKVKFDDGAQAIFISPAGGSALQLEVLTGDEVTIPDGGTLKALGTPAASASKVAFTGSLNAGAGVTENLGSLIFVGDGSGGFAAKVRQGDIAPGSGDAKFANFGAPALVGTAPSVVFPANLRLGSGTPAASPANDSGLWTDAGGQLQLIAREGATAPGTGGKFEKFLSFASDVDAASVNAIAFTARLSLSGSITPANNLGLWVRDETGTISLLGQTGQPVLLPSGSPAKITSLGALKASKLSPAQGRSTNGSQVVFRANLSGGRQGIFLLDMP